jgi:RNA polymerase sigma factor (TIGR02999 family)
MQVEPKRPSRVTRGSSKPQPSEISPGSHQDSSHSIDPLFTLLYNDFRNLAKSYLSQEARAHTLQPTALVNETYLKLVNQRQVEWKNRSHVLAVGAIAMRRILVNHAIAAGRQKRGGSAARVTFHEDLICSERDLDVLAVHQALHDLAKLNERHAKLVELRIFGGLSVSEAAGILHVSVSTVEKDWRFCSAWLKNALRP